MQRRGDILPLAPLDLLLFRIHRKSTRMMIHLRTLPLLFAATLAACGSDRTANPADQADSAASAHAAVERPAPDTLPAAPTANTITLAADGLELGAGRRLAFESARTSVLADVGGVLGEPARQGMQEECPAGPLYQVSYADGLQLNFRDSAFVGWFAGEGSRLRTAQGVGPGSTLGQLRAAYPSTKVEETSLGFEYAAGELYGVVTDTTDAGVTEVIFAGINCIFR